jgi:hypothetical protein
MYVTPISCGLADLRQSVIRRIRPNMASQDGGESGGDGTWEPHRAGNFRTRFRDSQAVDPAGRRELSGKGSFSGQPQQRRAEVKNRAPCLCPFPPGAGLQHGRQASDLIPLCGHRWPRGNTRINMLRRTLVSEAVADHMVVASTANSATGRPPPNPARPPRRRSPFLTIGVIAGGLRRSVDRTTFTQRHGNDFARQPRVGRATPQPGRSG